LRFESPFILQDDGWKMPGTVTASSGDSKVAWWISICLLTPFYIISQLINKSPEKFVRRFWTARRYHCIIGRIQRVEGP